jgi:LPXTG-motif cell wall-anchored protein
MVASTRRSFFVGLLAVALLLVSTLAAFAAGETVMTASNATLGTILTDANAKTLYLYTKDTPGDGKSACYDNCAVNWPPLTVPAGTTPTLPSGVEGTLATITRTDGTLQVTYNGWPLYFFKNDAAAGDTKGQGVGGVWFILNPGAQTVAPTPAPTAAATAAATTAATTAAAATATTAATPAKLPTTGTDTFAVTLALAVAGLSLAGFGLILGRRRS